jgi:integrase
MTYTIVQKQKDKTNANWYLRVREGGRTVMEIHLHTKDRKEAEAELMRVKLAASEGLPDPTDALMVRKKAGSANIPGNVRIFDAWEERMRVDGLRESSIKRYTRTARYALRDFPVGALTADQVKTVMARTVNLTGSARRSYANALANLFRFMKRHDLVEALPRKIKVDERSQPIWSRAEMEEIIMEVNSDTAERTLQYREYFTLMSQVGSRQSETWELKWKDLFDDGKGNGCIRFRGEITKSRKERTVPISFELYAQLEARRGNPEERIFNLLPDQQATRYCVLARALKRLGLKGNLHSFRRSVSEILYRSCQDIKAVSQLLGHSPQVALKYYQKNRTVDELRNLVED